MRYRIGDLVLVKTTALSGAQNRIVYEIDGVTEKMVGSVKEIRYESGDQKFVESSIEGKVILERPRAPRIRKSKSVLAEQLDIHVQDLEAGTLQEPMP